MSRWRVYVSSLPGPYLSLEGWINVVARDQDSAKGEALTQLEEIVPDRGRHTWRILDVWPIQEVV